VDWANERYVRVYVRDTADLLAVGWEGRAVLWELMRKCDRAGVVDFDGDVAVLAEMLRMPEEIVSLALPKLERRGVVERGDGTLVVPNFLEAQEASQSDKQRARESRARRRDRARHEQSQDATPASQNVTTTSHAVTAGHAESHAVTPCRAVPCRATPSLEDIVPAYAGTHPPERVEGDVPVAGALSAPASPALRAEPHHDHETPAQGKPDPVGAMPEGFALTVKPPSKTRRGKTLVKQGDEAFAVQVIAWLNAKRRAAGRTNGNYDPRSAVALKRVRWIRSKGWTLEMVLQALDLRVDVWRRAAESKGDDWTGNLHPDTALNTKLEGFVERAQAGDVVQAPATRHSHAGKAPGDDLRAIAAEMRRRHAERQP
jgi:hypothetical protein